MALVDMGEDEITWEIRGVMYDMKVAFDISGLACCSEIFRGLFSKRAWQGVRQSESDWNYIKKITKNVQY